MVHTVIPVAGKKDLKRAYDDHADQVRAVRGLSQKKLTTLSVIVTLRPDPPLPPPLASQFH